MRKRRIIPWIMLMILLLSGCGGNTSSVGESESEIQQSTGSEEGSDDPIFLTIATSGNWDGILRGELMDEYCEKIKEWSDGRIIVKCYYNGVLGTDLELIEAAADGTLCIINSVPSYQISEVPEAALLDTPGLFQSIDEYNHFIDSEYYDTINSYYQKAGLRLLSSTAFTYRQLTSTSLIDDPSDLQGLTMRTMENKYQMAFWQSAGVTVSPMNFSETRVALMQNMISAQENPISYMYSANLLDVQSYILLTSHMPMVSNYLMNEERFQELSTDDQELIIRMLREMDQELAERQSEEEEELIADLQSRGITITESTPQIQATIEQGRDVVLNMLRQDLGEAKVNTFLQAVEKYK